MFVLSVIRWTRCEYKNGDTFLIKCFFIYNVERSDVLCVSILATSIFKKYTVIAVHMLLAWETSIVL